MIKRSFAEFENQFTNDSISRINVPYGMLIGGQQCDATTHDNINDHLEVVTIIGDNDMTCLYKNMDDEVVIGSPVNLTDITSTFHPESHTIAIKLSPDDNTAFFEAPFNDTIISSSKLMELDYKHNIDVQYSSYNEYIIMADLDFISDQKSSIVAFATDLWKQANDSSSIGFSPIYNIVLFNPLSSPLLNKNLKYTISFDYSNYGCSNKTDFALTRDINENEDINKTTDITQNVIDTIYEYIDEYELAGYVLLDTNITMHDNTNCKFDSTTLIINEDYYINRQHVPPLRYQSVHDYYRNSNYYNSNILQAYYDGYRHVKLNKQNYTQFRYNIPKMDVDKNEDGKRESGFMVEFSGYNEIIEL